MTDKTFGLMIAYAIPGFILVSGLGQLIPEVRVWLIGLDDIGPTVAGFLFSGTSSIAAGLIVSAIRWAMLDTLMHATGLTPPSWSGPDLHIRTNIIEFLVDAHYRYYQFYANTAIAGVLAFGMYLARPQPDAATDGWLFPAALILVIVLLIAARDALSKYYSRAQSAMEAELPGSAPTA
mgnify:CR=1 FL=1